jgi:hypothetical protein
MRQQTQAACFQVPFLLVSILVVTGCNNSPVEEQTVNNVEPVQSLGPPVTVEQIKARGPRIYCVPPPEGKVGKVGEVDDTPWSIELVALASPCMTKVRLRHEDGQVQEVPLPPGTYRFAMGRQLGARTLLLLTHIGHGEFLPDPEGKGRLFTNEVDPTVIAITKLEVGWSEISTVVDRDEAVWLTALDSDLNMVYLQDSLFELMLFVQEGRPDTDGFYKAQLDVLPSGKVVANNPQRIGDYVLKTDWEQPPV